MERVYLNDENIITKKIILVEIKPPLIVITFQLSNNDFETAYYKFEPAEIIPGRNAKPATCKTGFKIYSVGKLWDVYFEVETQPNQFYLKNKSKVEFKSIPFFITVTFFFIDDSVCRVYFGRQFEFTAKTGELEKVKFITYKETAGMFRENKNI